MENMSCCDLVFDLYAIISTYLAEKRVFVTFVDYEEPFDRVDHSLLSKKRGHYDIHRMSYQLWKISTGKLKLVSMSTDP